MKTKKSFITALIISLFLTATFAQRGLHKTLIATVEPGESNMVFLNLPGEVETQVWDRNYIRIEIELTTNLDNEEVFEYLKKTRRYQVEKSYNNYYSIVLNLPNLMEEIFVNGKALAESFKFKIMTPWEIDVNIDDKIDLIKEDDFIKTDGDFLYVNQMNE